VSLGRRLDFDVVVIGGGMVGLCVVALLAQNENLAGWRIAMVEPSAPRRPADDSVDLRVSALSRASQRVLDVAGAWAAIVPHACPYERMVLWDAASTHDARDALRFDAAEAGEPDLGHIAENLRVQWALAEAPALRGITQLRDRLEGLEFDHDSAKVMLGGGRSVTAGLVVGADGGQSRTRELCSIGRAGWAYGQTAVVAHLRTERPHASTARLSQPTSIGRSPRPAAAYLATRYSIAAVPGSRSHSGTRVNTCGRAWHWSAMPRIRFIRWQGRV
jgi:2-octaprenylphenol hydroxylase